ncbi:MAG TPA: tyrosine-protein phosphatase, partial [Thermoanaerobaculia bacterium]|nr:tyrosine-protein phosphatase [Thermoanaerobaculia bacterium]
MARHRTPLFAALALSLSLSPAFAAVAPERPSTWAVAVAAKSVGNFYRIEPDFYRSGRPGVEGLRELQALGVKSVLDVESPADGSTRGSALKFFHVPMSAFGLHDDRVLEALRIMADPANRPIVIHCHHGADRTGAMVALYRVVVQGWSKEEAVREMNEGGYHHSSLWRNLDRYVLAANVDALRKELKIVKPSATLAAALAAPAPALPAAAV